MRAARVVTYCSIQCANQSDTGAVAAPRPAEPPKPAATPDINSQPASVPKGKGGDTRSAEPKPKARAKAQRPLEVETSLPLARPAPAKPATRAPSAQPSKSREPTLEVAASARSRRRTTILLASAAIMLGGVAILVVPELLPVRAEPGAVLPTGSPQTGNRPSAVPGDTSAEPAAEPVDAETALPSDSVLRAAAIRELESHLQDESRRFQRLAGIALARIQHEGAVARLAELLTSEPSDLSRIDIAYGMAIGGDPKGREYLVNELKSARRDARIDAARRLVQLGDDAGRKTLVQMLSVKSHRLGAASELAMLGDEEGLAVLRKELAEKDTTDENRMRAAVGLGRAGDQSARELLLTILQEGRFVVDAAGALAALGEQQAVPALERQLELSAMRVGAAESLQAMGVDVDLAATASALTHANEEGRIAAAEAIIILTRAEGG